jgi:hypothetical protein
MATTYLTYTISFGVPKVDVPHLVTSLIRTSLYEWRMVRCVSKNGN